MSDILNEINQFRDDRNWRKHHTPKNLAISISLECAELLENFQWQTSEQALAKDPQNIKEEIADILIYTLMLASDLELDYEEIIREKLLINEKKYPLT